MYMGGGERFFNEIKAPPPPKLAKSVHPLISKGNWEGEGRGIRDSHKMYGGGWGEMCIFVREIIAPLPQELEWENQYTCSVLKKGDRDGEGRGAYDKRQPQSVCRVGGVRRCVYLLMKSVQSLPPHPSWYTTRACTLSSWGEGVPCVYKTLHLIVTMFFKT